jgi:predicted transcriptional regulator
MMWNGLPVIRKEIASSMIKDYGLSQKETAQILGVTPAAICQYISKKRGNTDISDEVVLKEIKISAETIINDLGKNVLSETCRICKILRGQPHFDLFCKSCDE